MGFDWETYCLQWVSIILGFAFTWPLIGACIDVWEVFENERRNKTTDQ